MPMPYIQFSDVNGTPLAGGSVYTYAAGTSINQTTYTDSTGTTANTDPIVLNAGGEPSSPLGPGFFGGIYLTPGIGYRICVYNNLSVLQWCSDNVLLSGGSAAGSSANDQVLYNCAGAICGSTGLTYNPGTQDLSVTMLSVSSGGSLNGSFTGSPTFQNLTISGSLTVTAIDVADVTDSACSPAPAATGFIRMCNGDVINWRNGTNTADEGITINSSNQMIDAAAGGFFVTGANPEVGFGGAGAGHPALVGVGTVLEAMLADLSAPAQMQINGVTLPTNTPSGAGQVLTTTSTTAANWQTPAATVAIQSHSITVLAAPVSVPANSPTNVLTKAVTMPASGCPCRALVSYGNYLTSSSSGIAVAFITDGTIQFATNQVLVTGSSSNYGIGSSAMSTATYGNGVGVTFTETIEASNSGGITVNVSNNTPSAQASWMDISILTSN
jgi:hypothetical protein